MRNGEATCTQPLLVLSAAQRMAPRGRRREEAERVPETQIEATQHDRRDSDDSDGNNDENGIGPSNKYNIPEKDLQLMVKNFVRLALACEHTRTPIRREDIPKKVFVNDHKRCLPLVLQHTQDRLRKTFGVELLPLPAKDRSKAMTMTQQRKAAHTQASTNGGHSKSKASQSWILRNILPPELKQISQRQHMEGDRNYNAVIMIMIIIVIMSDDQCCSENRAISIFERLKWHPSTPAGTFDEVVAKMTRQGYLERIKDDQSTEGAFNLYIGPRGKVETLQNRDELFSVISTVYGYDEDESAQEGLKKIIQDTLENEDEAIDGEDEEEEQEEHLLEDFDRRRKKPRRSEVYEDS